jgi:hypothetical protein
MTVWHATGDMQKYKNRTNKNMTMNIIKNMILGGTDLDPLSQNIKQDMKRIGTLVKRTCENN